MGSAAATRGRQSRVVVLGLAVVLFLAWPLGAAAQPQPGAPATWQLEALVGFTRVAPDDLNARVAYDTAWLDYLPHGLVGYDVGFGSRVRLGGGLAAGWSLADCTLTRSSKALGGFYPNDRRTDMEMTGRGSAFAADALLTVRLALTARVGLLAEGGFAWNEVQSVSGALASTERIQDGEATEVELEQVSRAEGRWINQPVSVQAATSGWRGTVPSIGGQGTPFTLNLSGWRWRAGVSFGF